MFTGIVQSMGKVVSVDRRDGVLRVRLEANGWNAAARRGDSIAVDGVCLTLIDDAATDLNFDVVEQTLSLTTLGALRAGDQVHLEAAVTAATPLGGHLVQGHVDGVGSVLQAERAADSARLRIGIPGAIASTMVPQGSVCVSGVSLTVAACGEQENTAWFEVALIPETIQRTWLGALQRGARVNIETDYLAKLVARMVDRALANRQR